MSIISTNKEAKKEARRAYEKKVIEILATEHDIMNEMLNVLRTTDNMMTAAQIEAACTSGISKHEIASNLLAMQTYRSRYYVNYCYNKPIPNIVDIPGTFPDKGKSERIITRDGGSRRATVVELDENGHIVPNSKRIMTIHESKLYGIEKTK